MAFIADTFHLKKSVSDEEVLDELRADCHANWCSDYRVCGADCDNPFSCTATLEEFDEDAVEEVRAKLEAAKEVE